MTSVEKPTLRVRATLPHKTYIGAEFCANETNLRAFYEQTTAERCIGLNETRTAVGRGMKVTEATEGLTVPRTGQESVYQCLATIAAGQCQVYPLMK